MKTAALAVALAAFSFGANAAGLGKLTVLSGLGQPLRAEIDLSATKVELSSMTVRLAPPETFKETGVEYATALSGIKFDIATRRNGKPYLKLSSDRVLSEPFLDVLIQVDWAQGRLVREYTFLLDPPESLTRRQAVAPVTPPQTSASEPSQKPAPAQSGAAPAEKATAPTSVSQAAGQAAAGPHTVKRGETLRGIAANLKPEGVTVDQMLVAIFDANKSAFVLNNMNRLRAGAILSIPDRDTAAAKSQQTARREVVAQAASFNAYRRRVADATSAAAAPSEEVAQQSAAGKIVPRIEDKAPPAAAASSDQLKVSKSESAGEGAKADKSVQTRVAALQEDLVAREKALKEANSRLAELEKNVGELQKLLEMKNQSLAELQKNSAVKPAAPAEPAPAPAVGAAVVPPAGAMSPTPPAQPKPQEIAPDSAPAATPGGEAASSASPPPASSLEKPAVAPKPVPKKPAPAPVVEDSGFLSGLMDSPLALYGGGGALVALLAFVGFRTRQRKKAEPQPATALGQGAAQSVFGATGGQSVDTSASSIQTDFSHSGMAAIDADEGVDPVAEADVYMAYGRDAQAEEILLDALKSEPSRQAIRVKLLEIYAQRKNLKQFETLSSELYAQTGGAGPDWDKAAAMGRKLDPSNPLYGPTTEGQMAAGSDGLSTVVGGGAAAFAVGASAAAALGAPAFGADDADLGKLRDTWTMPGELARGNFVDSESVADASTVIKAAAAASDLDGRVEPVSDLNFDLPELEVPAAIPEANVTEPAALDFDLGLDFAPLEPATASEQAEPTAVAISTEAAQTTAATVLDRTEAFAGTESVVASGIMDFDLGPEAEPEEPQRRESLDADMPVMDLERTDVAGTLIDFNLDELTSTKPDSAVEVMDLERTDVGGSLLDFNYEADEGVRPPGSPEAAPTLDLSDISLDLPDLDGVALVGDQSGALSGDEARTGAEDENAEAATKLDLAKAYEEMGDREGARELLEEVVREGTAGQQDKARTMLATLA
ncbi:MAG: FimV/HubP family polar landmark protein [Rhodocyclaceae bacterium]